TDLPYGVTARNKWDSIIPFEQLWKEWNRIKKETTPIILTAIQPFTSFTVMSNPDNFKYEWIWEKERGTGFLNAKKQPLRKHEQILVFYDKQTNYNPIMEKLDKPYTHVLPKFETDNYNGFRTGNKEERELKIYDSKYPSTIIKFSRDDNRKNIHPTQKPIKLFEYIIKTYTNENDLVLDCCAGSGTTAIACLNTNRKYICIEKEPKYYEIMKNRIESQPQKITEFVTQ
ncbi:MAG: site-specific DNA-methyltransferase, partial [Candidatus Brocadiales bacterium]|nr:site-specific DNA-methyltransferase [Candidatus Brocadiales bacterium]